MFLCSKYRRIETFSENLHHNGLVLKYEKIVTHSYQEAQNETTIFEYKTLSAFYFLSFNICSEEKV